MQFVLKYNMTFSKVGQHPSSDAVAVADRETEFVHALWDGFIQWHQATNLHVLGVQELRCFFGAQRLISSTTSTDIVHIDRAEDIPKGYSLIGLYDIQTNRVRGVIHGAEPYLVALNNVEHRILKPDPTPRQKGQVVQLPTNRSIKR